MDYEQTIYYIESREIKKSSFKDFLSDNYCDETTTPKGVRPRQFVEFIKLENMEEWGGGYYIEDLRDKYSDEEMIESAKTDEHFTNNDMDVVGAYTISTWGCCGNHRETGTLYYSTKEAADEALLQIWKSDFQRYGNEELFETLENAKSALLEMEAYNLGIDLNVYKSILHHQECMDKISEKCKNTREEKEKKVIKEQIENMIHSLPVDDDEALRFFFTSEIHPAPKRIIDLKNTSKLSWNQLRNIYK